MKKLILLALLTTLFSAAYSQKGVVSGMLTDSSGKKPVAYATVTVFEAKDTSIVTYRLSDDQGKFRVPSLPLNQPLRAVITATGLEVIRKEFTLTTDSSQLDWGRLAMQPHTVELDEILLVAERPPVVYRNDTIEFNANAFKTLPSALVEDLLKKFPGVDVDAAGNISVNGRRANRILVDSREFFGSDPKVASRNLPANIIDKVQVTDDKEQLDRDPNINPAELGVVINLKLKRAIRKGWFGKVYGGVGTDNRFETGGIINMFRDTLQVSLLGYTNNLNRTAFSIDEVMRIGGFGRNNLNSVAFNSNGSFALNDIDFGGMSEGITRSSAVGVNANTLFGKKVQLSLQYFYGHNNTDIGTRSNIDQFFDDTIQTTTNNTRSNNFNRSHKFSSFLSWKMDSFTTLVWRPSFQLSDGETNTTTEILNRNNVDGQLNDSRNLSTTGRNGRTFSQELYVTRNFRKKGRSLYFYLGNTVMRADQDQLNDAVNNFYKVPGTTTLDQLRDLEQADDRHRFYARYTEPLSKTTTLTVMETVEWFRNKENIATYDFDPVSQEYVLLNEDFTSGVTRKGLRTNTNVNLQVKKGKWTFQPGVMLRSLNFKNEFANIDNINQDFFYVTPTLMIRKGILEFSYYVNITEPQASDLQPVANNSNPLYLVLGNPDLRPGLSHGFSLNAYKYNTKNSSMFSVYANGSVTDNAIIRARTLDEDGVQTTRPVNADGIWSMNGNLSYRKEHKFSSSFKFTHSYSGNVQFQRQFVLLNNERTRSDFWTLRPSVNLSLNWKDKIEWSQRYNPTWNKSRYEDPAFPSLKVWRHLLSSELTLRMPKKIVWENTVNYVHNPQVAPGIRKSITTWNAGVSYLFLKEDKAQVKFSVYDLLNQATSVSRTVRENYIQDMQTTILQRYYLLTFTYNIRNFGAQKVGTRSRILMF